ncbi:MAG: hypothetical protein MI923_24955 [Phycisphaerales bacterium]|nr:hypothetical protein [Phycisphaerales bacterium]
MHRLTEARRCSSRRFDLLWFRLLSIFRGGLLCSFFAAIPVGEVRGDDTAGLGSRTGRRPIQLWPMPQYKKERSQGPEITLGGWRYRVTKSAKVRDGVPWFLAVTPTGEGAEKWKKGRLRQILTEPVTAHSRVAASRKADTIPTIEIKERLWRLRMDADLQDVVGIHFHEYVSDDVARILYTIHKVPPDNPDGTAPDNYQGQSGTRLEATLLAPVVWSLDQSIVVRVDDLSVPEAQKQKQLTADRAKHEFGHAGVSQEVLLAVLHGPQNWNPDYCTGRRSHLAYYWRREHIGRSWSGYQRGVGKLLTLRTSIALVPPTRWSKLLPVPPERVTQKHIQQFNDEIVLLGSLFAETDRRAQENFHAHHGAYESNGP